MYVEKLSKIITEERNKNSMEIDKEDTLGIVTLINEEDKKVPYAVEKSKKAIADAIDIIVERFKRGGRLIYIGSGTSGRLGIVDASECPPTYGVDFDMVQGIIAGGYGAMFKAVEGAEDNPELCKSDLIERKLTANDVVCGIAASGRTPYVIGGMKYAKEIGAAVLCVTMNPDGEMVKIADCPISVVVGPEVIMGSTRMKAGTAQKLVLNMLTTGSMIKIGKVYSNLMVDVKASNEKLVARSKRIVMLATGADEKIAAEELEETKYDVKLTIFMIKTGLNVENAKRILDNNDGYIQKAIDYFNANK